MDGWTPQQHEDGLYSLRLIDLCLSRQWLFAYEQCFADRMFFLSGHRMEKLVGSFKCQQLLLLISLLVHGLVLSFR